MIERLEVDGVPVLVGLRPGPTQAGLVFRVGIADETLPTRGITHLIEHLALSGPPQPGLATNGTTSRLTTTFWAEGPPERIAAHLTGVCRQLSDLPVVRLDAERAVLRTEEAGRQGGVALSLWRYGAVRHGMLGYGELGRDQIVPDQVLGWARQNFTTENACLWLATDDDTDLEALVATLTASLSFPLPHGARRATPSLATTALRGLPAFFVGGRGGVALDALVPRTMTSVVLARVLQQQLFAALRTEAALSYAVNVHYDPVDADWAEMTVGADCLEENEGALVGLLVDQLAALAVGRIDPEAVATALDEARETYRRPDADGGAVAAYARDLLMSHAREDAAALVAELDDVSVGTLAQAAAAFARGVLVQVPYGQLAEWGGWDEAPRWSDHVVTGTRVPGRPSVDYAVIVGADGLSQVFSAGASTVRFDQAVAWSVWPDGGRMLVGADGFQVSLEPTMLDLPPGLLADLDRRVPPHLVLHRSPRPPEAIPQPQTTEPEGKRKLWPRRRDRGGG